MEQGVASELVGLAANPKIITDDRGDQHLLLPVVTNSAGRNGETVSTTSWKVDRTIPNLNPHLPESIHQHVTLDTAESFATYTKQFMGARTALWLVADWPGFRAVFDYHDGDGTPGPRAHTAAWPLLHSPLWLAWTGIDGKWLPQRDFAEFLEQNMAGVSTPPAARLMEIVATLTGTRNVDFTNAVRLANGDVKLTWNEKTEAKAGEKGDMDVPSRLTLAMPVFRGSAVAYSFEALLRYDIEGGKTKFKVVILNRESVVEAALESERQAMQVAVEADILRGLDQG